MIRKRSSDKKVLLVIFRDLDISRGENSFLLCCDDDCGRGGWIVCLGTNVVGAGAMMRWCSNSVSVCRLLELGLPRDRSCHSEHHAAFTAKPCSVHQLSSFVIFLSRTCNHFSLAIASTGSHNLQPYTSRPLMHVCDHDSRHFLHAPLNVVHELSVSTLSELSSHCAAKDRDQLHTSQLFILVLLTLLFTICASLIPVQRKSVPFPQLSESLDW